VSFIRQLGIALKIALLRRFRAPTIWMEVVLSVVMFVFVCIFSSRVSLYTDEFRNPEAEAPRPYATVLGPSPQYGMIPNDANTRALLEMVDQNTFGVPPRTIIGKAVFMESFENYTTWIEDNRQIEDHFYALEWQNSNASDAIKSPRVRLSSNGMTLDSLPDFLRTTTAAVMAVRDKVAPVIAFKYSMLPMPSVLTPDQNGALNVMIFGAVQFVVPVLTAASLYGWEAESGLRDLLVGVGLSPGVNRVRWFIEQFTVSYLSMIPFAIAIWGFIGVSIGLLLLLFLLGSGAMTSFMLFLVSLHPTASFGKIVGLGILLSFFVIVFWANFDFLYTEGGLYQKRILSLLPHAAIPYTLAQIASGWCRDFEHIGGPSMYPVWIGLTYLAAEMVGYYLLFVLVDLLRSRTWFPAPFRWVFKDYRDVEQGAIVVDGLRKEYGDVTAVNDVSFNIEVGETLAIVGPNGAGKSTLMRMLSGTNVPTAGSIRLGPVDALTHLRTVHRTIGFCPQENLFIPELKAVEWLQAVCALRGQPDFDHVAICESLAINYRARIGEMSGGNKRKVCLATALVANPSIVVLDEATSGVDITTRARIWGLISRLKDTTVIMATHTLEECERIADRIMVLADGAVSHLATPNGLRREFNCGYMIETKVENAAELQAVVSGHGIDQTVEKDGQHALVVLPPDEESVSRVLVDCHFEYVMTVQSLEEKIFMHVQDHEDQAKPQTVSGIAEQEEPNEDASGVASI